MLRWWGWWQLCSLAESSLCWRQPCSGPRPWRWPCLLHQASATLGWCSLRWWCRRALWLQLAPLQLWRCPGGALLDLGWCWWWWGTPAGGQGRRGLAWHWQQASPCWWWLVIQIPLLLLLRAVAARRECWRGLGVLLAGRWGRLCYLCLEGGRGDAAVGHAQWWRRPGLT